MKIAISTIPILDLSWADDPTRKLDLLKQLHAALLDVGFLYISNHGVPQDTISDLTDLLPALFTLPEEQKAKLSKLNSPHFLGCSGYAGEETLGKQDLRVQFDFATELPIVYRAPDGNADSHVLNGKDCGRDFTELYWRLHGPNRWPQLPGFREAFVAYHDAVQELSYRFVHMIEEAFEIPTGTFDHFFGLQRPTGLAHSAQATTNGNANIFFPPQHRMKLLRYPPSSLASSDQAQGVGAHKDSSGWLTFLYQVGNEPGLEVLSATNQWIKALPIDGTFVVNFANALEAATEGAIRASTHRVIAPDPDSSVRYSIPFFQGLPLDLTISEVRQYIPEHVCRLRRGTASGDEDVSSFSDPRWDSLGESQLRNWIRSHEDVGVEWYGREVVDYYTA